MPDGVSPETGWGALDFEFVESSATRREQPGDGGAAPSDAGWKPRSPLAAPRRCASGRPRAPRAAQFAPFAALQGYYDLIRDTERIIEPRHELTEDEAVALSQTIADLRPGDMMRVTYYAGDAYLTRTGCAGGIDRDRRRLQLVKTVIDFDDVRDIEILGTGGIV
ncbi:hypothetical protein Corgl_0697 [Coriobacterium glomerans PW2]|uniref:YolD-like protein n=1 Tax=Coriobacterium glomerans (strain ATCC 49209 / DSM 20642 / JCM 10262 / PW2) TaxID=700015 RepID=F2N7J5_CORGP|nr:hypothetical protein [Coriobacterium glomerans]AEB06811.1 hypothetical protein Corgl_0697 [Coriobacterium glomerans PW2]